MRITELETNAESATLNEGPIDFARKLAAGAKGLAQGGFAGASTGYRSKKAEIEQQKLIKQVSKNAAVEWGKVQAQLAAAGRSPTPDDAAKWLQNFMGGRIRPLGKPASLAPAAVQQWLVKEVGNFMAIQSGVRPSRTPPTPPTPPTPTPPTPPTPTPPTPPTPTPPTPPTPTPPTPPAPPPPTPPTPPTPTPPTSPAPTGPASAPTGPTGPAPIPPAPTGPASASTVSASAPTGPAPISIGGQRINPRDPLYQKIMQQIQTRTSTPESFDHNKSPLYNKLMELKLDEQENMQDLISTTAANPSTGQKIAQGLKKIGTGGIGLVSKGLTATAGTADTAGKIIRQFSGAPGIRSFASAADITSKTDEKPKQARPMDAGTQLTVPAVGNAPSKKYTLQGNTYVDSSGKPVDPTLNQILMAVNYGKVQRS